MYMFILDSTRLVKEFYKPYYFKYFNWSESSIFKNIEYGGFLFSLLKNYFYFLLLRMRVMLGLASRSGIEGKGYLRRAHYLTNLRFKHILIIEWGFYTDDYLSGEPFFYHSSNIGGFNMFRYEPICEYEVSHYDLSIPIHKTSIYRYTNPTFIDNPKPRVGRKFFFRFSYCLPFNVIGFVKPSPLSQFSILCGDELEGTPPPPISVNFPILFELLLLKFNICATLFSSSYMHIYEFYSLGFFESILIRFRSILDLLLVITLDKLVGLRKFSVNSCFMFEAEFYLLKLKSFYSIKLINSNFFFKIIHFNKLSYFTKLNYVFGVPVKLSFFFFKFVGFLIMLFPLCAFSLYCDIDFLSSHVLGVITLFRFTFLKFFAFFLLFFWFFLYFLNFLVFLCKLFKNLSSFLPVLFDIQFKIKYFFQLIFFNFFESFFGNFVGVVSYLSLLFFIFNYFSVVFFNVFLLVTSFYMLFSVVYMVSNILSQTLFGDLSRFTLKTELRNQELKVFSPVFFPFLLIMVPLCSFVVYLMLCFCYLLRVYLPPLVSKSLINTKSMGVEWYFRITTFKSTGLKAAFVDTTKSLNNFYLRGFDYGPKPKKFGISTFRHGDEFERTENLESYSFGDCGYFFKFILDRNRNLYELQYNYFDRKDFLETRKGYRSRTLTKFPNRFLYLFFLFSFFPFWLFVNMPLLTFMFIWRVSFFYLNLYYTNSALSTWFYNFFQDFIVIPYYYFISKGKDKVTCSGFFSLVKRFGANADVLIELVLENYYYCRQSFDLAYFCDLHYNDLNLRRTTYILFG